MPKSGRQKFDAQSLWALSTSQTPAMARGASSIIRNTRRKMIIINRQQNTTRQSTRKLEKLAAFERKTGDLLNYSVIKKMVGSSSSKGGGGNNSCDYSFKVLMVGDSAVGKSSLLLSFISNPIHDLSPTVGVDFTIKMLNTGGKRLKLTIWDTGGQERFGALRSSYYRGAHGIILVYDVTRRETFTNLSDVWMKDIDLYSTNPECVRLLVGNKVDKDGARAVTREEGMALAREHKCSFLECSAKTRENVQQCFRDLTLKILEAPSLMEKGSLSVKKKNLEESVKMIQVKQPSSNGGCCFQLH